jgi:molecular chaperone DnaK
MIKDSELNAEADKKLREKIEAKNNLETMIYQAEKMMKENGGNLPADLKSEVEAAVAQAKSKQNSEDVQVLVQAKSDFEAKLHKLSEFVYKNAQQQGADKKQSSTASSGASSKPEDNVVDAEFEDDSKK